MSTVQHVSLQTNVPKTPDCVAFLIQTGLISSMGLNFNFGATVTCYRSITTEGKLGSAHFLFLISNLSNAFNGLNTYYIIKIILTEEKRNLIYNCKRKKKSV